MHRYTNKPNRIEDLLKDFARRHMLDVSNLDTHSLASEMASYYKEAISSGEIAGIHPEPATGDRSVIAIDMGGTNVRVARIDIKDADTVDSDAASSCTIASMVRRTVPGRESQVTVEELADVIASMIAEVDPEAKSPRIGMAFSFPAEPCGRDSRIIKWDKELQIQGGEGCLVGTLINDALLRAGQPSREIAVVNDTVAAYMSHHAQKLSCPAGFILGTGENICLQDSATGLIYNLESGFYPNFPRGDIDEALDQMSTAPGSNLAEKMMSGAYRSDLLALACHSATREASCPSGCEAPSQAEDEASCQANDLLKQAGCEALRQALSFYLDRRAATYAGITVAAAVILSGASPAEYSIVADGSVLWKVPGMCEQVTAVANDILADYGISFSFVSIEEATLIGAAYCA